MVSDSGGNESSWCGLEHFFTDTWFGWGDSVLCCFCLINLGCWWLLLLYVIVSSLAEFNYLQKQHKIYHKWLISVGHRVCKGSYGKLSSLPLFHRESCQELSCVCVCSSLFDSDVCGFVFGPKLFHRHFSRGEGEELRFSLVAEIQCRTQSLGQLGESVLSVTWIQLWSYGVKQKTKGNELDVQMSSMVTTSWMASLIGTLILVGFLSFWSTILLTLRLKMKRTAWMDFPDLVWWSTWSTRLLFHPLKFVLVQLSLNPRLQIILAVPAHLVNKTFAWMQFNVVSWWMLMTIFRLHLQLQCTMIFQIKCHLILMCLEAGQGPPAALGRISSTWLSCVQPLIASLLLAAKMAAFCKNDLIDHGIGEEQF